MAESLAKLNLLVTDRPFRRFVITRALLMCSALSAPFYVALAQGHRGSAAATLGSFVVAAGLASLLSAPVWGRFADRSSKHVMIAAAVLTAFEAAVAMGVRHPLTAVLCIAENAIGPAAVSNRVTTRSLRANSSGITRVVSGETLNNRPGIWIIVRRVPSIGI